MQSYSNLTDVISNFENAYSQNNLTEQQEAFARLEDKWMSGMQGRFILQPRRGTINDHV